MVNEKHGIVEQHLVTHVWFSGCALACAIHPQYSS